MEEIMNSEMMPFEEILPFVKDGWTVSREGSGVTVRMLKPEWYSQFKKPFLHTVDEGKNIVPWYPTSNDILAEDWYKVEYEL